MPALPSCPGQHAAWTLPRGTVPCSPRIQADLSLVQSKKSPTWDPRRVRPPAQGRGWRWSLNDAKASSTGGRGCRQVVHRAQHAVSTTSQGCTAPGRHLVESPERNLGPQPCTAAPLTHSERAVGADGPEISQKLELCAGLAAICAGCVLMHARNGRARGYNECKRTRPGVAQSLQQGHGMVTHYPRTLTQQPGQSSRQARNGRVCGRQCGSPLPRQP